MQLRANYQNAAMDDLDRLGWGGGLSFSAFGCKIGVRVNADDVPGDILAVLPPRWVRTSIPEVDLLLSLRLFNCDFHALYAGHQCIGQSSDRAAIVAQLEQTIQSYLAASVKDRVFVHAGVVAWRDRAVMIPGRSMAGKSTLVKALLAAGATYYSDEFAVLDDCGRVHPYPRRLSIRTPNGTVRPTAESLGAPVGKDALPVRMVVQANFRAGAEWRPQRLSPGMALLELATYTRPQVSQTPLGQEVLGQLASNVPVYKGIRGDAAATARKLLSTLEANP